MKIQFLFRFVAFVTPFSFLHNLKTNRLFDFTIRIKAKNGCSFGTSFCLTLGLFSMKQIVQPR